VAVAGLRIRLGGQRMPRSRLLFTALPHSWSQAHFRLHPNWRARWWRPRPRSLPGSVWCTDGIRVRCTPRWRCLVRASDSRRSWAGVSACEGLVHGIRCRMPTGGVHRGILNWGTIGCRFVLRLGVQFRMRGLGGGSGRAGAFGAHRAGRNRRQALFDRMTYVGGCRDGQKVGP